MRKSLLYLFAIVLCVGMLTACSDDDKPIITWEDISKTYTGNQLDLGTPLIGSVGSVNLDAISEDKVNLTLTDVIPGENQVSLSATLSKGGEHLSAPGDFILQGTTKTSTCELTLNGYVLKGILKLDISRKITSPIAGNWNLIINKGVADLFIQVKGSPMDDLINSLGPVVGKMLAQKVENVSVSFEESGQIGVSYKTPGAEEVTLPPVEMASAFACFLTWYEKDGTVYLAVRKDIVDIIATLVPKLTDIDIKPYLSLLDLSGNYYVLPLQVVKEGDNIKLYVTKDFILKAWPVVKTLIPSDNPIAQFLPLIETALTSAQTVQLGLGFQSFKN